jgi:hypothetical protein
VIQKRIYIKILIAVFFIAATQLAMGSFSGADDKSKNKFSLKSISLLSKNFSLSSLHSSRFRFMGSQELFTKQNPDGLEINSMIRLQNGNTTYVYPYKYVIKTPKFRTPAAPHL